MSLPISDAWFHRIKSATRDLVKMCGGVERAGELAHTSKSEVSRWQTATADSIIPLAAVLALEAECGLPLVTAVMADLNGRRLGDPDDEGRSVACAHAAHIEAVRAAADMMAAGAAAFSDGRVTAAEAELLDRSVSQVEASLTGFRRALSGIKADGGLKVVQ